MGGIIFNRLLNWLVEGSIVVLIILILRVFIKNRIKKSFAYYLWLILIIKILIPISIESSLSVFNVLKSSNVESAIVEDIDENILSDNLINHEFIKNEDLVLSESTEDLNIIESNVNKNNEEIDLDYINQINSANLNSILVLIWAIGVIVLSIKTIYGYVDLRKKVRKNAGEDNELNEVLEVLKEKLQIKKKVKIKETNLVQSPMLMGEINPIILIPSNLKNKLSKKEIEFIILHELSHLKRKDVVILWLFKLVTIINFYNPLIRYSYKLMKEDCEKACDEYVLSKIEKDENINYGQTIIKVIENINFNKREILGTTMAMNKDEVKNRIINIKDNKVFSRKNIIGGSIIVLLIFIVTLTSGKKYEKININFNKIDEIRVVNVVLNESYKVINKNEDIEELVSYLNTIKLSETNNKNEEEWDMKIKIIGTQNYDILINENSIKINDEKYKINLPGITELKEMFYEADYELQMPPYNLNTDLISELSINFDNVYKFELITSPTSPTSKYIYRNEDIQEIISLLKEFKFKKIENENENGWDFMIKIYEDENYDITISQNKVRINNKLYETDYENIDEIKTLYKKLDYKEEAYEVNSAKYFPQELFKILDDFGYKSTSYQGYGVNIVIPEDQDKSIDGVSINEAFNRVYEKGKESGKITGYDLLGFRGHKVEMIIYEVTSIENPKDMKSLVTFNKNGSIISYYLEKSIMLNSSFTDEMFLAEELRADKTNNYTDLQKEVETIIKEAGYNILPNSGIGMGVILPNSFDYVANGINLGEALERIYEKSVESEEVTKDSLKKYLDKNIDIMFYSLCEKDNPNNYKDFIYFTYKNKLISYYFDILPAKSDDTDEKLIMLNLGYKEESYYSNYVSLLGEFKNKDFKFEEIKSSYIDESTKRYEIKVEDENLIVYEFNDKDLLERNLKSLKGEDDYNKNTVINLEDRETKNEIFVGDKLIIICKLKGEKLSGFFKNKFEFNGVVDSFN